MSPLYQEEYATPLIRYIEAEWRLLSLSKLRRPLESAREQGE
jgi:hypothetical protein